MEPEKSPLIPAGLFDGSAEPVKENTSVSDSRDEQDNEDTIPGEVCSSLRLGNESDITSLKLVERPALQYLSRNHLLSGNSPTLQLDVPAKLLSTEEDLVDEEPEMVIVEENQCQAEEEEYFEHSNNLPDMSADLSEPSRREEHNAKDIHAHISFNCEDYFDETLRKERVIEDDAVHEYGSFSTRPRLPFTFTGQTFNEQTQKLILNVLDFFKRVKKNPSILDTLKGPQDHAAAALNIGPKTIGKIAKRVLELGKLETPGKKRPRPKSVLDSVDSEGEEVIRSIIKSMHERRIAPTVPLVMAEASTKINFKGSTTSLRRLLKRMGYRYSSPENPIVSDKDRIASCGWKEKSTKRVRRKPQKLKMTETPKAPEQVQQIQLLTSSNGSIPHVIDTERSLVPHGLANIIHPRDIIIHYQKPDDTFHNQVLTVTGESAEVIQLQLDSSVVEQGGSVQEWHWQPCAPDALEPSSILKS